MTMRKTMKKIATAVMVVGVSTLLLTTGGLAKGSG